MNAKTSKISERRFFSKIFDELSQVEKVIRIIREDTVSDTQMTLLFKLDQSYRTSTEEARLKNEQLKAYWKKLLGPKINFGFFTNREIGTVFIVGPLCDLFLHDLDGKKLAELSEGPYGVLRGLGIEDTQASDFVKKLNDGHYLLLVRGHSFDIAGLEGVMNELDAAG